MYAICFNQLGELKDLADWNPRANDVFAQSIEIESDAARNEFVIRCCGKDKVLLRAVEQMLRRHEMVGHFLDGPAPGLSHGSQRLLADLLDGAILPGAAGPSTEHNRNLHARHMPDSTNANLLKTTVAGNATSAADKPAVLNDQQLDRYELHGEIARGGMGVILKGHDNRLGRELAFKALLEKYRNVPETERRFVEETQIGGRLQHPGIAPIYDLGRFDNGIPFFSMPLIHGQTLASALSARANPAEDRARFLGNFEQICQTIAYTHSLNIIHRDLKPANIMLGAFGEVQVMDWGVAKDLTSAEHLDAKRTRAHDPSERNADDLAHLEALEFESPGTIDGLVLGTPAYMAPEQARGDIFDIDKRADVFGLGGILCQIITGSPPYIGASSKEVYRDAANGNIEPCLQRIQDCDADEELKQLARECLVIDLSLRLRDASVVAARISHYFESVQLKLRSVELARAAEEARAKQAEHTIVAERKRRRSSIAFALTLLLSISAASYVWFWLQNREFRRMQANSEWVNKTLDRANYLRDSANAAIDENRVAKWSMVVAESNKAMDYLSKGSVDPATIKRATATAAEIEEQAAKVRRAYENLQDQMQLKALLDQIRLQRSQGDAVSFDRIGTDERYEAAFRAFGIDLFASPPESVAAVLRTYVIQEDLVAAIDSWARAAPAHGGRCTRLLKVANLADDNPWRRALREAYSTEDHVALSDLAAQAASLKLAPSYFVMLGVALRDTGNLTLSIETLRLAQSQMPNDFWLNLELGRSLSQVGLNASAVGFSRAAVAIRPDSAGALMDLALHLRYTQEIAESIDVLRRLNSFAPDEFYARTELAEMLISEGRNEEAIIESQHAIRINRTQSWGHICLGSALAQSGQIDAAITAYKEALTVDESDVSAYRRMADLLAQQNRLEEVAAIANDLIRVGDRAAQRGDIDQSVHAYRNATEILPQSATAHKRLGMALVSSGQFGVAVPALRVALKLAPDDADIQNELAAFDKMQEAPANAPDRSSDSNQANSDQQYLAARLQYIRKAYLGAAESFEELNAKHSELSKPRVCLYRTFGAYACVQASSSRSGDCLRLSPVQRRQLRIQAVQYLREVLANYETQMQRGNASDSIVLIEKLEDWQVNLDLAPIREMAMLEKLPEAEQIELKAFWDEVGASIDSSNLKYLQALVEAEPDNESFASRLADVMLSIHQPKWQVITPIAMKSDAGANLRLLNDGSVLVDGANVNGDIYHLQGETSVQSIAAIRIEALPHESLPLGGPGRGVDPAFETGNFVFTFFAAAKAKDNDEPKQQLAFTDAWADISHIEYPINTDGYWNFSAWSPGRGQGQPHEAIFEVSPIALEATDIELSFELRFQADPPELTNLGRFRISITDQSPRLDSRHAANGFAKLAIAREIADKQ